jgi:hypothetical protein
MTATEATAIQAVRTLKKNGFRVVPLPHGEKGPKVRDWQNREFDEADFHAKNGIGIKTGKGIVAIDIDCYGANIVSEVTAEFERRYGTTLRRTGYPPKTALLARCDVPKKFVVKLRPSGFAPLSEKGEPKTEQVEILTNGQQLVAFGIHPETGNPYHWHGNAPWAAGNTLVAALPSVSPSELQEFLQWVEVTYGAAVPSRVVPTATIGGGLAALTGYVEPDIVGDGGRNDAVLRHVGHLRGKGVPEALMLGLARNFNKAKCQPPLDDGEVERVVASYASQGNPDPVDWPEPLPLAKDLRAAPTFDYDMLPDVFVDFVRDASERMGAPPDYLAVPLMLSAAAALGSGWAVCPKANDKGWKETAVLWGGIVARPGAKKTPSLTLAAAPLNRIEAQLGAAYLRAKADYQLAKQLAKNDQSLLLGLQEPQKERARIQDTTYQKLVQICSASPKGVMAQWDEIAGMISAWRMKGQEAARGFFLTAWSGDQPYTLDRVEGGTTHVAQLFIVISGGVQPSVLGSLVRDAKQNGAANDGLIQRFQLMVYPDDTLVPTDVDRRADELAQNRAWGAVERLRAITPAGLGVEEEASRGRGILHFSSEAQSLFNTLRHKIEAKAKGPTCDPLLASHFSKMPGAIAKLAMLLHLLDGGRCDISIEATSRAAMWSNYLRGHAERIYSLCHVADEDGANRLLAGLKARALTDGFTAFDLKRKGWHGLKSDENIESALARLLEAGWLRPQHLPGAEGGRPTVRYIINPKTGA